MQTNFKKTSRQNQNNLNQSQNHVQIPCVFHNNMTITNFCCNKECLLPMCPVCVALHSQQHRQEKTHGQFLSIVEVIQNIQNFIFKQCRFLEQLSQEYTQDYWNKQKIIETCKIKLQDNKKRIIRQVERQFDQIFYELTKKTNEFHDNLHDKYKQLQNQIQYLYESLKSQMEDYSKDNQKILKNVIKFYSQQKQERVEDWCQKFKKQSLSLKGQAVKVEYNKKLSQLLQKIPSYFEIKQFEDCQNQYLLSTTRRISSIFSPKKQKQFVFSQLKQRDNDSTKRNVLNQQKQNIFSKEYDSVINQGSKSKLRTDF